MYVYIAAIVAVLAVIGLGSHRFLAVTRPIGEGVLVIEAWIPTKSLVEVPGVLKSGRYRYVVVVGSLSRADDKESSVNRAVAELRKLGCDLTTVVKINAPVEPTYRRSVIPIFVAPAHVVIVPFEVTRRTYASGLAVKQWLESLDAPIRSVDVVTVGVHARKSWVLFQHAMGEKYRVGIIAAPEMSYNPAYWLVSKKGVWVVARNLAGYCYFKCWSELN